MLKETTEDWVRHIANLKNWDKPIAEYARLHNLDKKQLYSQRAILNRKNNKSLIETEVLPQKAQFIPINISTPSADKLSIKILKGNISFELKDISFAMIKEIIFSLESK